ncbi:Bgt-51087 [Blumeria graminis f. sp. tritici]|uniref:Bgt-51087 n=1 Tax=Blumeria graminis f. sp. tritici TaxID=62690 RepID=A0A9X9L937_BLUGR|nr:Bgt-51087 [Blumeria graminis f. sp. tritici]
METRREWVIRSVRTFLYKKIVI